MSSLFEIFREATLLQCGFLEKLLHLDMSEVAAFSESLASFLSDTRRNKFVYGLAAGRSLTAM